MLSCSPRPASCFWERHPWRHFASSHLQDIILANPKPRENCGNGKVVQMVDSMNIHTNAILNHQISTPAQRSPHYYSPRPCWLPNDFTSMIFLHLVNLVTRTHETDKTQSISFAAASRAVLPVYERDGFSFCTYCKLSRGSERPSGKTVWINGMLFHSPAPHRLWQRHCEECYLGNAILRLFFLIWFISILVFAVCFSFFFYLFSIFSVPFMDFASHPKPEEKEKSKIQTHQKASKRVCPTRVSAHPSAQQLRPKTQVDPYFPQNHQCH